MKKIKNIIRICVFVVLLACMFSGLNRILEQKDSVIALKPFLDNAQEYDVLFIGDSHVRDGISPMELYHKYGIASYNLGTGNSRVPMSYWRLMNALDYADPKLVVFSVTDADQKDLTKINGEWLHVMLGGFPMTLTKARAIWDLTAQGGVDESGVPYSDIRQELFFPLRKYHSRWSSLGPEDFNPEYNTQKGAKSRVHVSDPRQDAKLADPDACLPEEGYGFMYLRRIIEECQKREIPLLLYQPPYPASPELNMGMHTCEKIAEEYGVPMLNMVDMDSIVDYYVDCADPGSHVNVSGVKKVTDFLGQYIDTHYDLPDRREDSAYAHWDDEWDAYLQEKVRMIAEDADSLRSRLMMLHDEDFHVVLTVRPGFEDYNYFIKAALQNIGRAHVYDGDEQTSAQMKPLGGLDDAAEFNEGYMLIVDRNAESEYEAVQEFYGIGEQEFETSFGYVFCRMDGEWIDLSLTQDDVETYYFDSWEDQDQDMRLLLIDRQTGKPALVMAFGDVEETQQ